MKNDKDSKVEQTRSRLSIDSLDQEDKKKLFNKFVDSGGQVVNQQKDNASQKETPQNIAKNKKAGDVSVGNHDIRQAEIQNPFRSEGSDDAKKNTGSTESSKKISKLQVFLRHINCLFAHIFGWNGKEFTNQFKEMTLKTVPNEFMNIKVFLDPIFKQTTIETKKFREYLCSIDLILEYEMAYHTYHLLDMKIFQALQTEMNISVDASENSFKKCYVSLFLFRQYNDQMKAGTSIIIEKFIAMNPNKKNMYYTNSRLEKSFSVIWTLWYLSVAELIDYYWTRFNSKNAYQSLAAYLEIKKPIIIGDLASEWRNQYINQEKEKQAEEDHQETASTTEGFPNDIVARGAGFIIHNIDFEEYMDTFKSGKDLRVLFQGNDQMFYVYAMIDYFDKEFNYLWTGDAVNFHLVPGGDTGRFDAKKEIRILNTNINQCYELVNEYLRLIRSYKTLLSVSKRTNQYTHQKAKEISRYSFDIRQQIYALYMKYYHLLKQILETKNSEDSIIGNWDDVLEIKTGYQSKLLQNKTVETAFQIVFEYVSAFCWLLKYSDLSGLEGKIKTPQVLPDVLINRK